MTDIDSITDKLGPRGSTKSILESQATSLNVKELQNAQDEVTRRSKTLSTDSRVAVSIRVRPPNEEEITAVGDVTNWRFTQNQIMAQTNQHQKGSAYLNSGKVYTFNRVFSPVTDNKEIYESIGSHLVERLVQGFNGTIFAYGQTGSGKTHTVVGPKVQTEIAKLATDGATGDSDSMNPLVTSTASNNDGILVHALCHLFQCIEDSSTNDASEIEEEEEETKCDPSSPKASQQQLPPQETNREYSVHVAYLEVYKEQINDLLSPTGEGQNLKISHDHPVHGAVVEHLTFQPVANAAEAIRYMVQGERNRHISSTVHNDKSSRSHSVFRVVVRSCGRDCNQTQVSADENVRVSCLNIVDLAGSERQGDSLQVNRTLMSEGNAINKSLLSLREVIYRLARNDKQTAKKGKGKEHIPYRGSKLTRILKQSLGGNACTSMVCTVSPSPIQEDETMNTIKFGVLCSTVENTPVVNELSATSSNVLLEQYKQEIEQLKSEMEKRAEEQDRIIQRSNRLESKQISGPEGAQVRAATLLQRTWRKIASRRLADLRNALAAKQRQAEELQRTMKMMWIDQIGNQNQSNDTQQRHNTPRRKSSLLLGPRLSHPAVQQQFSNSDVRYDSDDVAADMNNDDIRRRSVGSVEIGSPAYETDETGRNRSASFSEGQPVGLVGDISTGSSPAEESLLRLDEVRLLLQKKSSVEKLNNEQFHEQLNAERRRAMLAESECEQLRSQLSKLELSEETYREHFYVLRDEKTQLETDVKVKTENIIALEEKIIQLESQLSTIEESVSSRKEDWDKHDQDLLKRHEELSAWEESMKEWHERSTLFNKETEDMAHTINQEKVALEHKQIEVERESKTVQQEWIKLKKEKALISSEVESLGQERKLLDRIQQQVLDHMQQSTRASASGITPTTLFINANNDTVANTKEASLAALDEAIRRFSVLEVQLRRKSIENNKVLQMNMEATRQSCIALGQLVEIVHVLLESSQSNSSARSKCVELKQPSLPSHHPKRGNTKSSVSTKLQEVNWNPSLQHRTMNALQEARKAILFATSLGVTFSMDDQSGNKLTKSLEELREIANSFTSPSRCTKKKSIEPRIHYNSREPRLVTIDLIGEG